MESDRLQTLFLAYVNNAITGAEEDELMRLIAEPGNELLLKNLIDDHFDKAGTAYSLPDMESREIIRHVLAHAEDASPSGAVKPFRSWRNIAAAAAMLIVAVSASLFLLRNIERDTDLAEYPPVIRYAEDVKPGGDFAFLTLANDSIIILEQAQLGTILEKQGTQVIKSGSGELIYQEDMPGTQEEIRVEYHTLTTPRGGQFKLVLPDGSRVWLNAESSLRFPSVFASDKRRVEVRGEAYFEVAHRPGRPFVVAVAGHPGAPEGMEIEVLGTEFNVMAYPDERIIATTVAGGSVHVSRLNDKLGQAVLLPGQQAWMCASGNMGVKEADPFEAFAWKEGLFVFNDEHIESIMRKLARWYNVDVEYTGNLTYREFSGMISRYENISRVLEIFELTGVIHFEVKDRKVLVSP